jgi:hypothetical protein
VQKLDRAVPRHKDRDLRAWVTFLADDQAALDPKVVAWGKQHAIRNVPLGVFENSGGPPTYRLAADADVTVVLFVQSKVTASVAFRPGELNDQTGERVLAMLPGLTGAKK